MTPKTQKIPAKISDYIADHFREDFLFEVKAVKQIGGHVYYMIEVSKDNYVHSLRFNEDGDLVKEEADQAFPQDIHDEQTFEDVPE